MAEEDFKEFVKDLCSDIPWKDVVKKWGENIGALIPFANQYFSANMSSFEHEIQLRAIKKIVDAQDDFKNLLKEYKDFLDIVRKYEKSVYPFKIFNSSHIEQIQGELNWNPEFVKEYLPLKKIEDVPLDRNILLKGKIGIGKTRSIFRLIERAAIETVIVVPEYVRTLGVARFENLNFKDKAILIWDDVQRSSEQFLKALPYLKTKNNLLIIAAIRSVDYEKIEKDAAIREENLFFEVDLGLYERERMEHFVGICEKEFRKPLTDDLRKALVEKALLGDSTPLYVASIFLKKEQITKDVIKKLPKDVVKLWAEYFKDLTSNEKSFMKALKAVKMGFSPPFKELVESLYSEAFFGECRDLADSIESLKGEHWIVEIPNYYVCLDTQLECFSFKGVDMNNFLNCLFEKKLILEHHLQLLLGVGSHYYEAKNYDRVIEFMDRALELKSDYAEAYYNRGTAYFKKGEFESAIKDYTKAIEQNPGYTEAYYNRGTAYAEKGEFESAIKDYTKAIEQNPGYTEAYYNRGTAYSKKGEFESAIKDYTKAIEQNPDDAEAYYNRGNAYFKKGDVDRALRDYEESAILFLAKGIIFNAIAHFIQIFKQITQTKDLKVLCVECGLLAVFLMDKFKEKINSLEILKLFNYENSESLLSDLYQQKPYLKNLYSKALLYELIKILINENAELSEFLSKKEIIFLNKRLKDKNYLFEEIEEKREKLIVEALSNCRG